MFADRTDAGRQLGRALERYRGTKPLVLGLPRGGVVVAAEIARSLDGELDVLLVKKLRAPGQHELAVGAVSESERAFVNQNVLRMVGAAENYLNDEIATRRAELHAQQRDYRRVRSRVEPTGRTVILTDDGLATGATMIAAIQATSANDPASLIVAVPVGPPETARDLAGMEEVDEFVCLQTPLDFQGVGQFYSDFKQIEEETVVEILKEFA